MTAPDARSGEAFRLCLAVLAVRTRREEGLANRTAVGVLGALEALSGVVELGWGLARDGSHEPGAIGDRVASLGLRLLEGHGVLFLDAEEELVAGRDRAAALGLSLVQLHGLFVLHGEENLVSV